MAALENGNILQPAVRPMRLLREIRAGYETRVGLPWVLAQTQRSLYYVVILHDISFS